MLAVKIKIKIVGKGIENASSVFKDLTNDKLNHDFLIIKTPDESRSFFMTKNLLNRSATKMTSAMRIRINVCRLDITEILI